ncbi:FAD-dependent thymidylate synthase domain-containing protein [Pseudomonas phage EM]|uniref:FAD-dependent thymidylate synthase domain-containing protein n=1 Tax=Pseudomonas phage EM TaxID=2936914 RepID=A0AAE9HIB1_9CAUD|nr:FAD-dependent thymidylate synthase domain-containing protein [Pseudomonas phage EM]UPW35938.1 FAD-dependent thymidylate synthase domain-containing protein [Pseudomonas phage EM]
MTHRVFSRNAASSRAVPISKMIAMVEDEPAMPVHWGKNQKGMQAEEEFVGLERHLAEQHWKDAAESAAVIARRMMNLGLHKQVVNRILEPFQTMKTVLTTTEYANFFALRNHPDAQPEIRELAYEMWEALCNSYPDELEEGEWHMPYVNVFYTEERGQEYRVGNDLVDLDTALKVSASCCAQVSYRLLDDSIEKAVAMYHRLVDTTPVHASPFEHQATPIKKSEGFRQPGVTHIDYQGNMWSGNFKGFVQHRQLIPGHVVTGKEENA